MSEKKPRLTLTGAIIILSICIIYAGSTISSAIREAGNRSDSGINDYELSRFNDNFEELIKTLQE
ncbi:hypothetical protein [Halalkalibacter krulwichiae]|uniref:hypothetical protein n=1 Tax=Halalkalibacter krulwichiae TaxID=199441 RepID=UPI000825A244|nr:hypothetical protein [Halalkalibacter krulwichiae]